MSIDSIPTPAEHAPAFAIDKDGLVRSRPAARLHGVPQASPHDATPMRQPHSDDQWRDVSPALAVKLGRARRGELTDAATLDSLADAWCHEQGAAIDPVIAGPENIAFHQLVRADITEVADADVPVSRHETIRTSSEWRGSMAADPAPVVSVTTERRRRTPGEIDRIRAVAMHADALAPRAWLQVDALRHRARQGGFGPTVLFNIATDDEWLDDTRPVRRPDTASWPGRGKLPAMRVRKAERSQPRIRRAEYRTRHAWRTVEDRAIVQLCRCDASTVTPHVHTHVVAPDHDRDRERVTTTDGHRVRQRPASRTRIATPPRVDVRSLADDVQLAAALRTHLDHHPAVRIERNGRTVAVTRRGQTHVTLSTDGQTRRLRDRAAARQVIATT